MKNEVADFLSDQKFTFKYSALTNRFGDRHIFSYLVRRTPIQSKLRIGSLLVLKRVFNLLNSYQCIGYKIIKFILDLLCRRHYKYRKSS